MAKSTSGQILAGIEPTSDMHRSVAALLSRRECKKGSEDSLKPDGSLRWRSKTVFLICLWIFLDLVFGMPVIWRLTRTEAWVRVADPELHHAFRAMSHQSEQYGPEQRQIFINSMGGKDESCREVSLVAEGPRVVVFGDSFAEGWGLPFAETVPGQLRRLLRPQGVDVLGFGISSHCPSLTERWMKKLIREGVRWDTALLLIDPGDSYDEKKMTPFLEGHVTARRKNTPKFFRLRWYEYSLTYQAVRQLLKWLSPEESPSYDLRQAAQGNIWKVAWLDDPGTTSWLREGLGRSARAVQRMRDLAAEQRFTILLVIYPYPKMMLEKKLENEYTDFWKQFAQTNGLPLADLTPLFSGGDQATEKIYEENFIPGDYHWNARGSARIAEHLMPWIRSNLPAQGVHPSPSFSP